MIPILNRIKERFKRYGLIRTVIFFIWWMAPPIFRKLIDRTLIKIFRLLKIKHLKTRVNQTEIFIVPRYPWVIYRYFIVGRYDERETALIKKHIPRNYAFIDVGANFGAWTFSLADHFVQVLAFEPDPECFECLQKTKSQLGRSNVSLLNVALSHENKAGIFFPARSNKGDGRIYDPKDNARLGGIKIQIRSFDSMVQEMGLNLECLFLKLDAQGAEPWILRGMRDSLRRTKDVILWTEIQRPVLEAAGESVTNYFSLLKDLGFKPVDLDDDFKVMDFSDRVLDLRKKRDFCFRLQKA